MTLLGYRTLPHTVFRRRYNLNLLITCQAVDEGGVERIKSRPLAAVSDGAAFTRQVLSERSNAAEMRSNTHKNSALGTTFDHMKKVRVQSGKTLTAG